MKRDREWKSKDVYIVREHIGVDGFYEAGVRVVIGAPTLIAVVSRQPSIDKPNRNKYGVYGPAGEQSKSLHRTRVAALNAAYAHCALYIDARKKQS